MTRERKKMIEKQKESLNAVSFKTSKTANEKRDYFQEKQK